MSLYQENQAVAASPLADATDSFIVFPNHNRASVLQVSHDQEAAALVAQLSFSAPPKTAMLIISDAAGIPASIEPYLNQLCTRGIARCAAEMNAVVIDNGIATGVTALLGKGMADHGAASPVLGIVPSHQVNFPLTENRSEAYALEENHSHFILVNNALQNEAIDLSYRLIREWQEKNHLRVLTFLIGGGDSARYALLQSVRMRLPIIVFANSGGLADEIVQHLETEKFIADPEIAEIVEEGNIQIFTVNPVTDEKLNTDELTQIITRQLRGDNILKKAWKQFAEYDSNARLNQQKFFNIQFIILFLGVLGTFLVLFQGSIEQLNANVHQDQLALEHKLELTFRAALQRSQPLTKEIVIEEFNKYFTQRDEQGHLIKFTFTRGTVQRALVQSGAIQDPLFSKDGMDNWAWFQEWLGDWMSSYFADLGILLLDMLDDFLRYLIVIIPITVAALLGVANRFNWGSKWILLRGSAELLKSEIFCYRIQADAYSSQNLKEMTREMKLANKLKNINNQLVQTEVNTGVFESYTGHIPPAFSTADMDDGLSLLTPEQYLSFRLEDQLNFYIRKTTNLNRDVMRLQWLLYGTGALGTLLAAVGMELWIALTTSLTAAFGAYLKYRRLEETLITHNQARIGLTNVQSWWVALSASEQAKPSNIDTLVAQTEGILKSEFGSWVQDMQESMSSLREEQLEREKALEDELEQKYLALAKTKAEAVMKKTVLAKPEHIVDSKADSMVTESTEVVPPTSPPPAASSL